MSPQPVTLTAAEIAGLVRKVVQGGGPFPVSPALGGLTSDQLERFVAIALRESGGVTGARRPASQNPLGGNDLGLFQLNDKANRFDGGQQLAAFDAFWNAHYAVRIIGAGGDFSPWGGPNLSGNPAKAPGYANSHPLTITAAVKAAAANPVDPTEKLETAGHVSDSRKWKDTYGFDGSVTVINTNDFGPLSDVLGWADSLGKLLANLLSPTWWRRVGVGALGLLLLVFAVVLAARSTITKALTP